MRSHSWNGGEGSSMQGEFRRIGVKGEAHGEKSLFRTY